MHPVYRGPQRRLGVEDIAGIVAVHGDFGIENALWIHGNAAVVELPGAVESQRASGSFNRVIGKPNTTNWIHLALPSPTVVGGRTLTVGRFLLRAVTGSGAILRDVRIHDGGELVARHDAVNMSGPMSIESFGVASGPPAMFGVSASLGFTFTEGDSNSRRVDLISAGFDYRR